MYLRCQRILIFLPPSKPNFIPPLYSLLPTEHMKFTSWVNTVLSWIIKRPTPHFYCSCAIHYVYKWLLHVSTCPCFLAREFQAPMGTYSVHYGTMPSTVSSNTTDLRWWAAVSVSWPPALPCTSYHSCDRTPAYSQHTHSSPRPWAVPWGLPAADAHPECITYIVFFITIHPIAPESAQRTPISLWDFIWRF